MSDTERAKDHTLSRLAELGSLPPATPLTQEDLCMIFQVCAKTLTRAVDDGRLPAPARLFGRKVWMVGALLHHIEGLLDQAAKEQARNLRTIVKLRAEN